MSSKINTSQMNLIALKLSFQHLKCQYQVKHQYRTEL